MENRSSGKRILAMVLAALFGVCASGLSMGISLMAAFFSMIALIAPMLSMFLYGFGGIQAAAAMLITMEIGSYFAGGITWTLTLFLAAAIPAATMIYFSAKGAPFFRQIRYALAAQALGLVAVLALMYLHFGADLGTVLADYVRDAFSGLDAEMTEAVASIFRNIYQQAGLTLPEDSAELLSQMAAQYEQTVKVLLPVLMVSVVGVNGGIGVLWGNYLRARHGEANVKYVAMSGWRLPARTVAGLLFTLIATYALASTGNADWLMVNSVFLAIGMLAAQVQACASILSRLRLTGMSAKKRAIFFVLMLLFLNVVGLVAYGVLSAFIGSKGLITTVLKARVEKKRRE